jgi:hypothetical protein
MGQFSVKIYASPGSSLSANQHFADQLIFPDTMPPAPEGPTQQESPECEIGHNEGCFRL